MCIRRARAATPVRCRLPARPGEGRSLSEERCESMLLSCSVTRQGGAKCPLSVCLGQSSRAPDPDRLVSTILAHLTAPAGVGAVLEYWDCARAGSEAGPGTRSPLAGVVLSLAQPLLITPCLSSTVGQYVQGHSAPRADCTAPCTGAAHALARSGSGPPRPPCTSSPLTKHPFLLCAKARGARGYYRNWTRSIVALKSLRELSSAGWLRALGAKVAPRVGITSRFRGPRSLA